MLYLCLGYHNEQLWSALPAEQRQALVDESLAYESDLKACGYAVEGTALKAAVSATTLRFEPGGKMAVTDGPFAETKEQLGGIMVLKAKDLNHVISLMSRLPCMRVGGSLEIRPINEELSSRPTVETTRQLASTR